MFIKIGIKKTLLLLGLVTILLASFLFIVRTYALDEFIDDYTNYNYVQARNNVVRNTTFNAMELDIGSVSNKLYENYSAYTEVDVIANRIRIQNDTNVLCFQADLDETFYLYDDYGSNYFGDFEVDVDVLLVSQSSNGRVFVWSVSNEVNHWAAMMNGIGIRIRWHTGTNLWQISLGKKEGGVQVMNSTSSGTGVYGTWIFFTVKRVGASLTLDGYTDRARTNFWLERSLTLLNSAYAYRYSYGLQSDNIGLGLRQITLNCMFLWYHNHWDNFTGYYLSGYFYTVEVLSNFSGSSIVLLTNATIPSGDIKVEFSNDNTTWRNHNNQIGSDTLIIGYEAIDLRDLNYTSLYMRFNYTTGDTSLTPRLYQIRVITTDIISVGGGSGAIGLIVASFILVPIISIIVWRRKRRR